jgi:hypothetical protein
MIHTASPKLLPKSGADTIAVGARALHDGRRRWPRWIVIAAAMVLMPDLCARGAENSDSNWHVTGPLNVLEVGGPVDPTIRIAIKQFLRESPEPLIETPPPAQQTASDIAPANSAPSPPPLSSDGWRSTDGGSPTPAIDAKAPLEVHVTDDLEIPSAQFRASSNGASEPAARNLGPLLRVIERPLVSESEDDREAVEFEPETIEVDESDESRIESPALAEPPAAAPLPPLTRNMQYLRNKVRRVLRGYYNKPLNSRDNDPWEMMHGMLAYELESRVRHDGPRGQLITSVGWLCYNKPCKRMSLLRVTPEGELRAKYGVGLQGHMGQFLAMLAQCNVSPDYPILVSGRDFTIQDLIEAEKITCKADEELTFKLIALMHYLESDARWVNEQGEEWNIERLIREELAQPIRGAACGGTHRLAGLGLAARKRVERGEPLDGEFARAADYIKKYHSYAFQLQNRDGSLSTEWFHGRGDEPDIDRRVKTTGHILEWLIYSLGDEELHYPRTVRAVSYLANLLYGNFNHEWEIGPRSHALHALRLYDERVFQPYDDLEDVAAEPMRRPTTSRTPSRSRQR